MDIHRLQQRRRWVKSRGYRMEYKKQKGIKMPEGIYNALKEKKDNARKTMDCVVEDLTKCQGYSKPKLLHEIKKEEIFKTGLAAAVRIAISTVISTSEKIGWENYMNLIYEKQTPGMKIDVQSMIEEFNILGKTPLDVNNLGCAHAKGCGFDRHEIIEFSPNHVEGVADWCPMIHEMHNMGYEKHLVQLYKWCNAFDTLYMHILAPDVWYVHSYCLGRGDRYCRLTSTKKNAIMPGENFYRKMMEINNEERQRLTAKSVEPDSVGGFFGPQFLDEWEDMDILLDGVKTKFGIATDNILISAQKMGWENFLEMISEEQSPGFSKAALDMKMKLNLKGHSLRDAAVLALFSYQGLGFKNHQLLQYTDKRVEGFSDWCPMIEQAEKAGLTDTIEDLCLWCDFYQNHQVHAVNPEYNLIHTHCLGTGDKYCRFLIE